jgi:hypothetical protein
MAKMGSCACGWTVITPLGDEDVVEHIEMHLSKHHPGTKITEGEIKSLIKTV